MVPSDHAPVSMKINVNKTITNKLNMVLDKSKMLGKYEYDVRRVEKHRCRKQIRYNMINNDNFINNITISMNNHVLPDVVDDIDECVNKVSDVLYDCVKKSRIKTETC